MSDVFRTRAEEGESLLAQDLVASKLLEQGCISLSERDFERFVDDINNPKPPTPNLITARRAYRQLQAEFPECNL